MPVFQYAVFALAAVSVVFARDPLVASTGRSLLSHGNDTDTGLLVTYWGQNSAAPTYQEPDLDEVCAQYNITAIAFLSKFGKGTALVPNVASHNISKIGAAITACQSYGTKILLSLGGQGGDSCGYGFSSGEDAAETALNIWQLFLGGYPNKKSTIRPFGNAVLDGIDLDIECAANGTDPTHYSAFVQQLRALMSNSSNPNAATASLGTASYLITAAPQCIFPDAYLGPVTDGLVLTSSAMQIDYLWPQFYNNPTCQFNTADKGASFHQSFQNWSSWAASAAPPMEVLAGLPASTSAAATGYMSSDDEEDQIKLIRKGNSTNFDGVMLWSAAWESANEQTNQSYLPTVISSLTDPVHSGAEPQQLFRRASLIVMLVGLLVCLL